MCRIRGATTRPAVDASLRAIVVAVVRTPWRWLVGFWLLASPACGGATPADGSADSVYVLDFSTHSGGGFEGRGQEAWVHDVAERGVADARWFRARGDGPTLAARLRYQELQTDDGPVLRVHLLIDPDTKLSTAFESIGFELDAFVELVRRDRTIELRRDLPIAVERAIALVDAKVTVSRGDSSDIERLLGDEDPEVVKIGLLGVGRLRLRELGDKVVALVEHDDELVAMSAVECLGVIGGPEHTPELLRSVRLADRAYANRLYEALANLGGEQARGFLQFAARNEEDPELASLAERALVRLDEHGPRVVTDDEPAVARGHRQ